MKLLKKNILLIIVIAIITIFFIENNFPKNWRFYVEKSIGANNELSLYDNLTFDGNSIIINSQDKSSYSIDKNSGNINWQFKAQEYSPFPPTIYKDMIFLSNFDGSIYRLDKKSGYKIWQFNIDQQFLPDTPVVNSQKNEIVFFGSRNAVLYALDRNSGKQIWTKEFKKPEVNKAFVPGTIHFGTIYADEDQIYVLNALEKTFFSIDQVSGRINWEIRDISFNFDSPLFYNQKIIIKQNKFILSIDKKNGSYEKIKRIGNENVSWKIFKIKGDDQNILILDGQTLSKKNIDFLTTKWQLMNIDDVIYLQKKSESSTIDVVDNIFFAQKYLRLENKNSLLAIDYDKGQILWNLPIDNWISCYFYSDGDAFFGGNNGEIYSVNKKTKKINWKAKLDGETIKISVIKNNILTINQKAGKKISLNYFSKDGKEIWQYVPDLQDNENEIYLENDILYFINSEKKIIEKIKINEKKPNQKKIKNINFLYEEVKNEHDPYLKIISNKPMMWLMKEKWLRIIYIFKNIKNVYSFEINEQIIGDILEISIKNDENLYKNKFVDLKIEATFKQVGETKDIKIKGFYYDNNTWKIRFSPQKSSNYEYKIKIKSPYLQKEIDKTIFLENNHSEKISIDNDQFTINDNKIFFPIGIENAFFDQDYDGNLMSEIPDSNEKKPVTNQKDYSYTNIENYLDIYKNEAGLNIFRYGVENWTPKLWDSINLKNFSLNVNGGKFGDKLVQELKQKDFKIIMTIFGFNPPYKTIGEISKEENKEAISIYLDYVISRFSPYVDLWELNNEAEANENWYNFVIDYLKKNDPYQHPISTNWETSAIKKLDFLSVHWYNPEETDAGNLSGQIDYLYKKHANPKQPILISEFGFKNNSYFKDSSESLRILTWLSVFQKMGIIFWNQGQNGIYSNKDNANIYLGPIERNYLLNLHEFLPQNLFLPIEKDLFEMPSLETQVFLLKNKDFILAYLLKINSKKQNKGILELNFTKKANLKWIDPKTNQIIEEKNMESGQQKILIPDFETDLALKINYIN